MEETETTSDPKSNEVTHWPVQDMTILVRSFLEESRQVSIRHVVIHQEPQIRWTGVVSSKDSDVPVLHFPENLSFFLEQVLVQERSIR